MNLNSKICLYNPYVIVHLKSQKRQIFRYGGSNILGVYQNKSDFFQVCEQVLLFYYFGSVATQGHIASKRKRPVVFASHPHTVCPARRSRVNVCCVAFSLTSGTAVEQTDYRQTPTPPTARWLRKQEGEEMAVAWAPRKLVLDGTRVGGVCRTAKREC